jgi:predicted transposase YdaD
MEGLQEGLWQGEQNGLREGEMKGRMEGRGERAFEIARNAWSKGLPLDIISEITGLDAQIIQGLNRQL